MRAAGFLIAALALFGCQKKIVEQIVPPDDRQCESVSPEAARARVSVGDAVVVNEGRVLADERLPQPPVESGVVAVDLGNIVVGDDGITGTMSVLVSEGIFNVTVVAYADDEDAVVVPVRVVSEAEGRDALVLVDDTPIASDTPGHRQIVGLSRGFTGQFMSPLRTLPARGEGAFDITPKPDGLLHFSLGQYDVLFDDDDTPLVSPRAGTVRVVVLVRWYPALTGEVPLAVHLTGAGGLSAATADQRLADALDLVAATYIDAGIEFNDVTLFDVEEGEHFTTVPLELPLCEGAALDALVELGSTQHLNIFVVDAFECGSFGPLLIGMAAGLPGVPWAKSPKNGIVVSADFLDDTDLFAFALAHELGHALGLFHAKENDRFGADIFDHIDDTPNDDSVRDNLMFFDVSNFIDPILSPGQGRVLRAGPWMMPTAILIDSCPELR